MNATAGAAGATDASKKPNQRKRSSSLTASSDREKKPRSNESAKQKVKGKDDLSPIHRPSSEPVPPVSMNLTGLSSVKKGAGSADPKLKALPAIPEVHFTPPAPPQGLDSDVFNLILRAKFHEAYSLLKEKSTDLNDNLSVKFLRSLSAAIPIPTEMLSKLLLEKLETTHNESSLVDFAGDSSFASDARDVSPSVMSFYAVDYILC